MKINKTFTALVGGVTKYFRSSGTGASDDPFVPHHVMVGAEGFPAQITGFGELLTATQEDDISVRFGANMPAYSAKGRIVSAGSGSVTYSDGGYAQIDSTGGDTSLTSVACVQYRIGHANFYKMTACNSNNTGSYEVGPHDGEEGFFITVDNTGAITGATIRTDSADTTTAAANFNGDDLSGIDFRKYSIFYFLYGWLGVYPPTIWTLKSGKLLKIHTFPTDEGRTTPHVRTPALPIRLTAKSGCIARTSSWNGGSIGGRGNSSDNPVWYRRFITGQTTGNVVLANFRIKSTDANGDKVRIRATLQSLQPYVQANTTGNSGTVIFRLYAGVTLGGSPSWALARADSLVEVDTAGTLTSGAVIWDEVIAFSDTNQGGVTSGNGVIDATKLGAVGWAGDYFTLTAERISGAGTWDANISVGWVE